MCGIAGVLHFDGRPACPERLRAMISRVQHRGPDAAGVFLDNQVGLAHARLAILDLEHGRQPMQNRDGTLTVTFNGEVFNHVELRETLVSRGHHFLTRSDTEVILHAYEEWGQDCVNHFNGQWAFVLWDQKRQALFLSRDRLGIRPLYYTVSQDTFLFASEIKSLFANPEVERALDPRGLNQLFTLWSTLPPTTMFQRVSELPPGHNVQVRDRELAPQAYWQLDYPATACPESPEECAEQLHDLLTDATRLRLRADVPIGAYLSGGLDSSITAALARRTVHDRLQTFSLTFADKEFDESSYQRQLARHLDVEHQALRCSYADIARVFPEVVWHAEKPVLRTAPAPLFLLSKLVHASGFKVVLTGEGADEILGGYDIFKEAKVRRFCARQPDSDARRAVLGRLYPYLPNMQMQSIAMRQAFFRARSEDLASPFFSHLPRWELTSQLKRFFTPELYAQTEEHDVLADLRGQLPRGYDDWHPFCKAQYLETAILLPGYILSSQGDRMSLAHAVEGRFPFLDHRVAEFSARIPARWKMKGLNEKHILKRALGGLVPQSIVERTKQPYRAPDAKSFFCPESADAREEYVEELLSPARVGADGLFRPDAVERLVQKVRAGRANGTKDNMALVGILSTQLLVDQFVNGFPRARRAPASWVAASRSQEAQEPILTSQEWSG